MTVCVCSLFTVACSTSVVNKDEDMSEDLVNLVDLCARLYLNTKCTQTRFRPGLGPGPCWWRVVGAAALTPACPNLPESKMADAVYQSEGPGSLPNNRPRP